jgi:hypothetical protein
MRWNPLGFVAALTLGALVYDATALQALLGQWGWNVALEGSNHPALSVIPFLDRFYDSE